MESRETAVTKADNHDEDIQLLLGKLNRGSLGSGVIHVGAHMGEEVSAYIMAGFEKIILVEANPSCCERMEQRFSCTPQVKIFNCAISNENGIADLHIHTSGSGSTEPASLLDLKRFKEIVRTLKTPQSIKVECLTLDSFFDKHNLCREDFGLLNLDIQGAELRALQGAQTSLKAFKAVITEVEVIELYRGSASEAQIDEFMQMRGFRRLYGIYHTLYDDKSTFPAWGECLFVRAES